MRRSFTAAVGITAAALLLTGCAFVPVGPVPAPEPTASDDPPASSCPDIEAHDFAVGSETTPADPAVMMESVGLGDLIEGACAYGFESPGEDGFDGVAFFIIAPTPEAASEYLDAAVQTAADAGFSVNHTAAIGQSETNSGPNDAGDSFLVAWFAEVNSGDGTLPDSSMEAIGLESGQSVIIGSVQLAG
jgi:hypothetical protein